MYPLINNYFCHLLYLSMLVYVLQYYILNVIILIKFNKLNDLSYYFHLNDQSLVLIID